jgi:hypothetical protein
MPHAGKSSRLGLRQDGWLVMPGPVPGIHVFLDEEKTWMAGTSSAMKA